MARKTIDRDTLVNCANRMIGFMANSNGNEARQRRLAIITLTSQTLLDGNSYRGYRYLNPDPPTDADGNKLWDESRIYFN